MKSPPADQAHDWMSNLEADIVRGAPVSASPADVARARAALLKLGAIREDGKPTPYGLRCADAVEREIRRLREPDPRYGVCDPLPPGVGVGCT